MNNAAAAGHYALRVEAPAPLVESALCLYGAATGTSSCSTTCDGRSSRMSRVVLRAAAPLLLLTTIPISDAQQHAGCCCATPGEATTARTVNEKFVASCRARSATVWSANVATAVQPMSTRPAASAVCQHTRCAPVPRAPIGVTPRRHRGHAACSPAPAAKSAASAKMLRLLRLHRAARRGGARIIRRFGAASASLRSAEPAQNARSIIVRRRRR